MSKKFDLLSELLIIRKKFKQIISSAEQQCLIDVHRKVLKVFKCKFFLNGFYITVLMFIFNSKSKKRMMKHQSHNDRTFDFYAFLIQENPLQQEVLILSHFILKETYMHSRLK